MSTSDPVLKRVEAICLALPDTELKMTWGKPHFYVGGKVFAGFGREPGSRAVVLKLSPEEAARRLGGDPRFTPGSYGGTVEMDLSRVSDWDEVRALVTESWRLSAPKGSLAKLPRDADPA